jgi:hypothetical protein
LLWLFFIFVINVFRLQKNGEEDKAAAIAIFFLKMKKALQILSSSAVSASEDGRPFHCILLRWEKNWGQKTESRNM